MAREFGGPSEKEVNFNPEEELTEVEIAKIVKGNTKYESLKRVMDADSELSEKYKQRLHEIENTLGGKVINIEKQLNREGGEIEVNRELNKLRDTAHDIESEIELREKILEIYDAKQEQKGKGVKYE